MQIRFSFPLVFVFDQRYVLKYADQSRLRFAIKNICMPVSSFVLVLRCRLTNDMYQLRSNDRKLHTEKPNTNFLKKSFSYRGAVSWNSLPGEIVDVHDQLSLSSFKTLINHYYKDLEKNTSTI